MPNQLNMSKIQSVLALRQQGWPFTRIAQELGIHRETVAQYVRQYSRPAEAPTGGTDLMSRRRHFRLPSTLFG
jgi:hypothetical protein